MGRRGLTTTQRGYDWRHRRARALALDHLVDGQPCARCGQPMYRAEAAHLDLDHTDDRSTYRGLAHRSCNRRAGQAKAQAQRHAHANRAKQERTSSRAINSQQW